MIDVLIRRSYHIEMWLQASGAHCDVGGGERPQLPLSLPGLLVRYAIGLRIEPYCHVSFRSARCSPMAEAIMATIDIGNSDAL